MRVGEESADPSLRPSLLDWRDRWEAAGYLALRRNLPALQADIGRLAERYHVGHVLLRRRKMTEDVHAVVNVWIDATLAGIDRDCNRELSGICGRRIVMSGARAGLIEYVPEPGSDDVLHVVKAVSGAASPILTLVAPRLAAPAASAVGVTLAIPLAGAIGTALLVVSLVGAVWSLWGLRRLPGQRVAALGRKVEAQILGDSDGSVYRQLRATLDTTVKDLLKER